MAQKKTATYTQEYGKPLRAAAGLFERGRKKVASWDVPDSAHWDELLVKGKLDLYKLATWLKENAQTGIKWSGAASLWMMEYLIRGLNGLLVDNAVLRAGERGFAGKKKKGFAKNNPAFMSHLVYWMLMAGVIIGGGVALDNTLDEKDAPKKEIEQDPKREVSPDDAAEGIVITSEIRTVGPDEAQFVQKAMAEYWPEIAVGLTELETYRATPKRHGTEKRSTNGLGCTYTYYYDKNGTLYRNGNSINVQKVRTFDKAGNYEQCKRHLMYEALPMLKTVIRGKNNIGAQQAVALVWAGYQRPADMPEIAKRISNATTVQQVADAFAYYPGAEKWRTGTLLRRWWCAAYAVGLVDINDFLQMDRDAFSHINLNNVYRNGHFVLDAETVKYALTRTAGTDNKVVDFLDDFAGGRDILARVQNSASGTKLILKQDEKTEQSMVIERSMALLNKAEVAFRKGKYEEAVKLYEQAIDADQDNMEAYSSLAFTYKKLGDKTTSIKYYEKCIKAVKDGNARMNANKSLLLDRDVKAASYYNAGAAREAMAKIYQEKGNRASARENYNLAIKNYKTALDNADMQGLGEGRKRIYQESIDRATKQLKELSKTGKKVAFKSGIQQIRQKNAKKDLLLYGQKFDGNMA